MINQIVKKIGKYLQEFLFRQGFIFDFIRPSNMIESSLVLLLRQRNINSLIDIGANRGQFLDRVRILGYEGEVLCVEPLLTEAKSLIRSAKKYPNTRTLVGSAVSNKRGKAKFNISKNSVSSSLNDINERHIASAEGSESVNTQTVDLITLSELFEGFIDKSRIAVKIDVQGHENIIVDYIIEKKLEAIKVLQVELSRVPLYAGADIDMEVLRKLHEVGFEIYSLGAGFSDARTGEMLQYDAVLIRD